MENFSGAKKLGWIHVSGNIWYHENHGLAFCRGTEGRAITVKPVWIHERSGLKANSLNSLALELKKNEGE